MPVIELATSIAAPIERVFDLARSIELHTNSTLSTGERAVAGVTSGLIGPDQEVTWRARHFGVWQALMVRVTEFERPKHFADVMLRGAFRRMEHRRLTFPHALHEVLPDRTQPSHQSHRRIRCLETIHPKRLNNL